MFDIIVKKGRIVDGTGNPWFFADLAVKDGRIVKINRLITGDAEEVINAEGCVVSAGFIDMHSHSDYTPLFNPYMESKIIQGVTTEVIGNCGFSAAPINDSLKEEILKTSPMFREADVTLDWATMAEYIEKIEKNGIALNIAPLVGHGNIRSHVLDFEEREPSRKELEEMKRILAQAMDEGAFGMSTGLIYPPGCYARTEEIVELCKVVAAYGGLYSSHIRGEDDQLLTSVKEAIEIGEKAGIPVEISHHKASGKNNWGMVKESLKMIDQARSRGADVTCDVYPYTAASFSLDSILPPHSQEGGVEKLIERLRTAKVRQILKRQMMEGVDGWNSMAKTVGWKKIMVAYCKGHPEYEGRMIWEIAKEKRLDPFDFVFDLLIEENASVDVVLFCMSEEDVRTVLKSPFSMIGSDSSSIAPYGILSAGKPHPRAYGTFTRILRKYVREERVITLQEAIRKMTSFPAQKLGLRNRGLIREGMWADISIFDAEKIIDKATYANPHCYSEGVEYVIVNGKTVLKKGKHTRDKPGRVLSRSNLTS